MAVASFGPRGARLEAVFRSCSEALTGRVEWLRPARGGPLGIEGLLGRFGPVAVVALDLPLARGALQGPRRADQAVACRFGAAGAGVHSPRLAASVSAEVFRGLERAGLRHVAAAAPGRTGVFLEVHPHAAILHLLDLESRLPYKVARRARYWPQASPQERLVRIATNLDRLREGLAGYFEGVDDVVPRARELLGSTTRSPARLLKGLEDALDAAVCAYVAAEYLRGNAVALGDDRAAIWVPSRSEGPGPGQGRSSGLTGKPEIAESGADGSEEPASGGSDP